MFWQIQSCSIFKNARINIVWGDPSSLFWWSFFQSLDFTLVSFSTSVYGLQKIAKGDGSKLAVTKHGQNLWGCIWRCRSLFWCPSEKCWPPGWVLSSCPPCSTHPFPFLSPSWPCPFNPFSLSGGNRFQGGLCTHLNHLSPGLKVLPRRCCVPLSRVGRWQTHLQGAVGYVWLRASKQGVWTDLELGHGQWQGDPCAQTHLPLRCGSDELHLTSLFPGEAAAPKSHTQSWLSRPS